MNRSAAGVLLALLTGCGGPQVLSVSADPTDARISYSSTGPSGTFIPAGRGKASVVLDFKADAQGNLLPFIVRVTKDGFATQDFEYSQDVRPPRGIAVRLDTFRAVATRELDRTPDGVAVVARTALAEVDEVERSNTVKNVTRVTNYRHEDRKSVLSFDISPGPSATRIVLEVAEELDEGTAVDLWMMTPGQELTRFSPKSSGYESRPTFSRDGQNVYFSSTRSGPSLIWRTRATGSGASTRITSGNGRYFDPHASRGHLVYTEFSGKDRPSLLWVSNPDGGLPSQLREGESGRWSTDSQRIVFIVPDRQAKSRMPPTKIWVMDADGGNARQLTSGESTDIDPSWSPDGTKVVFASNQGKDVRDRSNFDIWMMNADGSQSTQLTTNGSEDVRPVWDPSGKHIYFRSNRGLSVNLWRMELASQR